MWETRLLNLSEHVETWKLRLSRSLAKMFFFFFLKSINLNNLLMSIMIHSKPRTWVLRAGLQNKSHWENPYQLVWVFFVCLFWDCIFSPSGLNIARGWVKKALGRLVQSAALSPIWDYLKVNKALSALPVAGCTATFHIRRRTGSSAVKQRFLQMKVKNVERKIADF